MLLKVGVALILFSLALGAVVVTAVAFRADSPEAPAFSAEPRAAEITKTKEREYNPGEKLEIDDEPRERPKREEPKAALPPLVPQDWPEPSGEEVAAANTPRYYPPQTGLGT